jgi:perosamine synthetase
MQNFSSIPHSRPWITAEDKRAVQAVLGSRLIATGELVTRFEREISEFVGAPYSTASSSGTAALITAIKVLGIRESHGVILPTYICRNVLDAVLTLGAEPQPCDVNQYGVIDPESVDRVRKGNTKAIIAAHIFGNPCDINSLKVFNLPIIEDACQAFGLEICGKKAGIQGEVGVFSFHATKNLTTAEGGMLVSCDPSLGSKLLKCDGGRELSSAHHLSSISDLQAALGLSQLKRFSEFVKRRKEIAKRYSASIEKLSLECMNDPNTSLPFRYTVRAKGCFNEIQSSFASHGIVIRRGVDSLIHRFMGLDDKSFPGAVKLFNSVVSLPFYPSLTRLEQKRVLSSLHCFVEHFLRTDSKNKNS